jgi:hypothetical protein
MRPSTYSQCVPDTLQQASHIHQTQQQVSQAQQIPHQAIYMQQIPILPQQPNYTECSFCRLIRCPGSFVEYLIGRRCGSPWQTVGHSFGDQLISAVLRATKCYRSFLLLCSVLCLYGSCEIQLRRKSFHLWLLCENKLTQIMQKKISQ